MKEWAARLLLAVAGIMLSLAAAELYLRHFSPRGLNVLVVRPDGILSHVPGLDVMLTGIETRARVETNREGLRDVERTIAKPPGVIRVLVIGDSMIEGLQVELPLTMPRQLQRRLEESIADTTFDVINAGVSGNYGPRELLYLEKEGFRYDPDLVVITISTRNDVWEAAHDTFHGWAAPRAYGLRVYLRSRYHLYSVFEGTLNRFPLIRNAAAALGLVAPASPGLDRKQHAPRLAEEVWLYDQALSNWERKGYRVLFDSYDAIMELCRSRHTTVLFVLIPSYFQATGFAAALGNPMEVARVVRNDRAVQEVILKFLEGRNAMALDLLPGARKRGEELFLPVDQHFSAAGNAFAAEETARVILGTGMLSPEPETSVAGIEREGG